MDFDTHRLKPVTTSLLPVVGRRGRIVPEDGRDFLDPAVGIDESRVRKPVRLRIVEMRPEDSGHGRFRGEQPDELADRCACSRSFHAPSPASSSTSRSGWRQRISYVAGRHRQCDMQLDAELAPGVDQARQAHAVAQQRAARPIPHRDFEVHAVQADVRPHEGIDKLKRRQPMLAPRLVLTPRLVDANEELRVAVGLAGRFEARAASASRLSSVRPSATPVLACADVSQIRIRPVYRLTAVSMKSQTKLCMLTKSFCQGDSHSGMPRAPRSISGPPRMMQPMIGAPVDQTIHRVPVAVPFRGFDQSPFQRNDGRVERLPEIGSGPSRARPDRACSPSGRPDERRNAAAWPAAVRYRHLRAAPTRRRPWRSISPPVALASRGEELAAAARLSS